MLAIRKGLILMHHTARMLRHPALKLTTLKPVTTIRRLSSSRLIMDKWVTGFLLVAQLHMRNAFTLFTPIVFAT